ncbi:MAG TPA: mucoidy inhibitor MuiA family protein [Flavobacteriales bacterium]|nr:mucoidy inhibitor MuiA family protein [Flavobacteriales bacterium]
MKYSTSMDCNYEEYTTPHLKKNYSGVKNLIIILVSALTVSHAFAQNNVLADSKTTKATLFLSGAQVHRSAKVNLTKGANIVKLTGLRQNLSPNSIIVEGNPNFTIVSVEHKYNYLRKAQEMPQYQDWTSQKEKLRWDIKKVQADKSILEEELNVLRSNMEIKGREETMNIERLIDYSEVYNDKMVDISIKKNELEKKEREYNERMGKLNAQLQDIERTNNKSTTEIWVTLNANSAGNTTINFNYYTSEALWRPFYDVRTKDSDDKVDFVLKGKLIQSTGETWEKVNLTLSTGNPSLTTNLPALSPWSIYSVKPSKNDYAKKKGGKRYSTAPAYGGEGNYEQINNAPAAADKMEEGADEAIAYNQPIATAKNNLTTIEYTITEPYTLAGDNQFYDVDIVTSSTTGKKTYYTAPGYEEKAYTVVEMPEWTKLNLLSGEAAMYYNDNYVGRIVMNTEGVEDTLSLSFGPDNNVLIKRRQIHSKERNQVAGTNRTVNRTIEISLRNTKTTAVELDIDDQLPVAYNKSITIEKMDVGGAKYDEKTGYLTWKVKLAPGETKKIVFSYKVKYPKGSSITNF